MKNFEEKDVYNFEDLVKLLKVLRGENGCPWDRVQTHKSIRNNFIEEVYEAIEAIDTDNTALLREELGDVLLQVVFHIQIAESDGEFCLDDVTSELVKKLIVRHPHIFGDVTANTADQVLENWDAIKKSTKGQKTTVSSLDSVSPALPAPMRAIKLQKKAKEFYPNQKKDSKQIILSALSDEGAPNYGELLFELCNLARLDGLDPEEALEKYNQHFIESVRNSEICSK